MDGIPNTWDWFLHSLGLGLKFNPKSKPTLISNFYQLISMPKLISRKEWIICHVFIILGSIFLTSGIFLHYHPVFPPWIPLIDGIWTLFGGFCLIVIFFARKLNNSQSSV